MVTIHSYLPINITWVILQIAFSYCIDMVFGKLLDFSHEEMLDVKFSNSSGA
jgi:hypothetical protein